MHARHQEAWYETVARVRSVTYVDSAGGVGRAEIWYESIALPGTVRNDLAPLSAGRGELFRADSTFRFEADSLISRGPAIHVLLLLGFDVYRQPVDRTIEKLVRFGFSLAQVEDGEWQGEPVWVVGDPAGPRFWVDRRLLLVRRIALPAGHGVASRDIHFNDYAPLGGGWIATELVFHTDGKVRIRERSVWWAVGLRFDPALFATRGRSRPTWVRN